ncbi:MAG: hypothetical protein IJX89_03255 [Alphaproteobacteria bacterium]|nr:hypothetical protein [Alphaproteobacteria bacterium]
MYKIIAIILMCVFSTTAANAAPKLRVSQTIHNAWGGATMNYCGTNDIPNGCIGEAAINYNCENGKIYGARYKESTGGFDDEFANLVMLAREINEHGAMFCPTQANGQNKDSFYGYVTYNEPNGNNKCVWLCQTGYSGDKCNTPISEFTGVCSITPFTREDYNGVTAVHNIHKKSINASYSSANNIASQIVIFYASAKRCSYIDEDNKVRDRRNNGHHMTLALTRFLDSGNGAFARQMIIQSHRTGADSSDLLIYPASQSVEILVCKNGYTANLTGTDCEPIDSAKCTATIASTKMCTGWSYSSMNPEIHEITESGTCYKYRCKESGKAFNSASDQTCVECPASMRGGTNPANNTCVKCETGTIFNKSTGQCSNNVIGLSKTDLMYGRGKTKNSHAKLNTQCWLDAGIDLDTYKNCVLGIGENN